MSDIGPRRFSAPLQTIPSRDGTCIAVERRGSGPPLVLVPGTVVDDLGWVPNLPAFERRFSVHTIHRRGRAPSGDSVFYSLEREAEDIATVIEAIGEPVELLGYSYGALCALEATLLTDRVRRLVLFETPIGGGRDPFPAGALERLEELAALGDGEALLDRFLDEVVRMPARERRVVRAQPSWPERVRAAHTLAREMRAIADYELEGLRFLDWQTPTLLLTGGDSAPFLHAASARLAAALDGSCTCTVPGRLNLLFARMGASAPAPGPLGRLRVVPNDPGEATIDNELARCIELLDAAPPAIARAGG